MTTATKTAKPAAAFDEIFGEDGARSLLASAVRRARADYDAAQKRFVEEAATNPALAIDQNASRIVAAQARMVLWTHHAKMVEAGTGAEAFALALKEARRQRENLIEFGEYRANSTCPWRNAKTVTEAEAKFGTLKEIITLLSQVLA
jgi:hypothetical protein